MHAMETWWQSGARSSSMPGLSTHLAQELNVGTVEIESVLTDVNQPTHRKHRLN